MSFNESKLNIIYWILIAIGAIAYYLGCFITDGFLIWQPNERLGTFFMNIGPGIWGGVIVAFTFEKFKLAR